MQRGLAKNRPALDWDDLRVFLALLRARSLTGGAKALSLDKSTVSRRVQALERALGARLFLRTREGLRVSAVGEQLRPHAERVEAELRSMESVASAGGAEVSGIVRVATTEGMAPLLVQAGLLRLREEHPELELELLSGNRPVELSRGEADLAVRLTPLTDAALSVRVLARLRIAAFASASYLRDRGAPRSPAELAGHDVVVPSGELSALPEARWLAARANVRVVFRSSSIPALVEAAARGHGVCAVSRPWGAQVPELEHLFDLEQLPARPVWLAVHPDVAKRAAVRVVAERVADIFRERLR